jgi:hypothetical protein
VAALLDDFARLSGEGEISQAVRNEELKQGLRHEANMQRSKS